MTAELSLGFGGRKVQASSETQQCASESTSHQGFQVPRGSAHSTRQSEPLFHNLPLLPQGSLFPVALAPPVSLRKLWLCDNSAGVCPDDLSHFPIFKPRRKSTRGWTVLLPTHAHQRYSLLHQLNRVDGLAHERSSQRL